MKLGLGLGLTGGVGGGGAVLATNLWTWSEDLSNADWTLTSITLTANATAAPDGQTTADLVTTSTNTAIVRHAVATITPGVAHTASIYLKRTTTDWMRIIVGDGIPATDGVQFYFNINTGVTGSSATIGSGWTVNSIGITDAGNGWYRAYINFTSATDTVAGLSIVTAFANNDVTRTVTHYYAWGAMLNSGALSTYVPRSA
jgi:hypothetical protein